MSEPFTPQLHVFISLVGDDTDISMKNKTRKHFGKSVPGAKCWCVHFVVQVSHYGNTGK